MSRPRDYFECPQHPDVPETFFQLAMAADDWSPVYFDPRQPDVAPRRAEGSEDVFPEIVRWIDDDTLGANPLRHLDYEGRPTPEFEHLFDPAEFLLACHLRYHIGQWVEDAEGWPFTFQYIPVDDDAESTPVGWMLALTSFKPEVTA